MVLVIVCCVLCYWIIALMVLMVNAFILSVTWLLFMVAVAFGGCFVRYVGFGFWTLGLLFVVCLIVLVC